MRIGIDLRPLQGTPLTGVGSYTFELLMALCRLPSMHSFVLFESGLAASSKLPPLPAHVRIKRFRIPNILFHASSLMVGHPQIDRILGGVDIFFSPNLGITALSARTRHILTIHDLSFEFFPDCFSFKQRLWHKAVKPKKQCKEAAAILVPSEHTKRDVVSFYGVDEKKVYVIPHGVSIIFETQESRIKNQEEVRKKYQLPEKYLLYVGAIEPRKNVDGLIEAYCSLNNADYSLVLVGPKGYRADALLSGMRGRSDIRYLGYIPEEDKPALYAGASLFVYPSFYEGFGLPVLEAFAAGVPVVTSNRSSLPDVARDAAYLVNPYNVAEIAMGISTVLSDDTLRQRMILSGIERSKQFQWGDAAARLLQLFSVAL